MSSRKAQDAHGEVGGYGGGQNRQNGLSGHSRASVQKHPYLRKFDRVLERMGGLYTLQDILDALNRGEMQSFVVGESVAITRIALYPRAKVVEIIAVAGKLSDARVLHDRVLIFASEVGAKTIQAYGRMGWLPDAQRRGWKIKAKNYVYQRDIDS